MRKPLELYIHIPFCQQKCRYCDFLSQRASRLTCQSYVEQLIKEIIGQSASYREYDVTSVFLGGGTPSILREWEAEQIMKAVKSSFHVLPDAEITIEVNPGTVTLEKLEVYRTVGINRLSIGLQSANDEELRVLGRIHTYEEFLKTYQRARLAGFQNINIDLMSALPGQTLDSWKNTLKKVTMLRPEHISAYSLIIEEGTPFYEQYGGHPELLPPEDEEREMYYFTKEFLAGHGYERYEISNYARPGLECRHNVGYWTGAEYLGLGLGASSYVNGKRFHNERDLKTYMELSMEPAEPEGLHQEVEEITEEGRMEEFMILGLRMMRGVSGSEFLERFGQNMWNVYGPILRKLQEKKLIQLDPPFVRLTDLGVDVSNSVLCEFLR